MKKVLVNYNSSITFALAIYFKQSMFEIFGEVAEW